VENLSERAPRLLNDPDTVESRLMIKAMLTIKKLGTARPNRFHATGFQPFLEEYNHEQVHPTDSARTRKPDSAPRVR
jgi:hypothetical protein